MCQPIHGFLFWRVGEGIMIKAFSAHAKSFSFQMTEDLGALRFINVEPLALISFMVLLFGLIWDAN